MARKAKRRLLTSETLDTQWPPYREPKLVMVTDDSMAPRYERGDALVVVVPGPDRPLHPGDGVVVLIKGAREWLPRMYAGRRPDGRWDFVHRVPGGCDVYFPHQVIEVRRVVAMMPQAAFR